MAAERGFTLLEVLVAFIIAALALGVLFGGGIGGLTAANVARRYQEAISRAESHLAMAGNGPDFQPQDRQGDEGGGYHWHLRIAPVELGTPAAKGDPVAALYAITVTMSWTVDRNTRSVTLQTARTGIAPPAPP
jgi:general secretion pathway protein I